MGKLASFSLLKCHKSDGYPPQGIFRAYHGVHPETFRIYFVYVTWIVGWKVSFAEINCT
jgi:hypothetical protein